MAEITGMTSKKPLEDSGYPYDGVGTMGFPPYPNVDISAGTGYNAGKPPHERWYGSGDGEALPTEGQLWPL